MGRSHHPRRGSMQFWPRKRSKHSLARVRSWAEEAKAKPLGFIGYKAGMTRLLVEDNRPKALTKGEKIVLASTIIECPPMVVVGIAFYKRSTWGLQKTVSFWAEKPVKELAKNVPLPKKSAKTNYPADFDDLRLLVHSQPKLTTIGTKKPKWIEVALGGSKEEKLNYAQSVLGKEISVADVFSLGHFVDVHGITKGKGFQGTVKRFGVPIRQHKAEKTKRGIGTLGPWHPHKVAFSVAQSGKMGYHLRTEYNKQIISIDSNGQKVTPTGGLTNYGQVKNTYLLLRGSVVGPQKRAVLLIQAIRTNPKWIKEAPSIAYISVKN